jgi:beta-1,4-N-acetylglucosaminyltransferase
MQAFVTVGSTRFDELVDRCTSGPVLAALSSRGYTSLVVQSGNSAVNPAVLQLSEQYQSQNGVDITIFKFKPTLAEEFKRADLVIGHAGRSL